MYITMLVEFSDRKVAETKEINENIYIDLDTSGNLVRHFWMIGFNMFLPVIR